MTRELISVAIHCELLERKYFRRFDSDLARSFSHIGFLRMGAETILEASKTLDEGFALDLTVQADEHGDLHVVNNVAQQEDFVRFLMVDLYESQKLVQLLYGEKLSPRLGKVHRIQDWGVVLEHPEGYRSYNWTKIRYAQPLPKSLEKCPQMLEG